MKVCERIQHPILILVLAFASTVPGNSLMAAEITFPSPTDWKTVFASEVGWDSQKLMSAVDFAMSRRSSGVVILHGGRLLAERYSEIPSPSKRYVGMVHGKDAAGHTVEDVASCQKSVTSLLVGIAQEKGLLKISEPVHKYLGEGWSNATQQQERQITIRHLISMSSGLGDRLRFVTEPGTRWRYNTNAYCLSLTAVAAAAEMTPDELTKKWLTGPLGMSDSRWVARKLSRLAPPETNKLGFATTARDLARFGLLVQARGRWNRTKILASAKYLTESLRPSQKMNRSYGYLWWLNGQNSALRGGRLISGALNPSAPGDLVAALGALGRKCYVVPSLNLVVTRLGDDPNVGANANFDREFWRLLMQAAPKE